MGYVPLTADISFNIEKCFDAHFGCISLHPLKHIFFSLSAVAVSGAREEGVGNARGQSRGNGNRVKAPTS